ncbi:MAG: hypothetical protein JWN52_324 [Actinomycetia bacterium]|nr:hypothetical protein [Actinomycetes bacterium]
MSSAHTEAVEALLADALLAAIHQYRDDVPDQEAVLATAGQITSELDQQQPDTPRIHRPALATAAGPITAITTAVTALQKAITGPTAGGRAFGVVFCLIGWGV